MCYVVSIVRFASLPHIRDVEVASALTERTRLPPPSPRLLQLESLESLIAIAERIHDLVMRKYVPVPALLLSPHANMLSAPVEPHTQVSPSPLYPPFVAVLPFPYPLSHPCLPPRFVMLECWVVPYSLLVLAHPCIVCDGVSHCHPLPLF